MSTLDNLALVIGSHGGRDKAIRTMGYALHLIAGQTKG